MNPQTPSPSTPAKKVLFVGHCGPDSTYLRMLVRKAIGQADVRMVEEPAELEKLLQETVDLILFNRELGYGFEPDTGVEFIRLLKQRHPSVPMMLISNYPEAQTAAVAAGALPGFGKREIGSPHAAELLRAAVGIKT
jgi:two-component system chemotaxis response regulator CheY